MLPAEAITPAPPQRLQEPEPATPDAAEAATFLAALAAALGVPAPPAAVPQPAPATGAPGADVAAAPSNGHGSGARLAAAATAPALERVEVLPAAAGVQLPPTSEQPPAADLAAGAAPGPLVTGDQAGRLVPGPASAAPPQPESRGRAASAVAGEAAAVPAAAAAAEPTPSPPLAPGGEAAGPNPERNPAPVVQQRAPDRLAAAEPGLDGLGAAASAAPADQGSSPPGHANAPHAGASHQATPGPAAGAGPSLAGALPAATLPALATGIVAGVAQGRQDLTLQLEPADLGRVDVALRVDEAGRLHAAFTVERPETLQLLQRDARGLEQALAGGGLSLADAGLSFGLRREGGGGRERSPPEAPGPGPTEDGPGLGPGRPRPARSAPARLLDLRV